KGVAKQALPQLGQIAGDFVAPGAGGSCGAKAGGWLASKLELGLELEGLSAEDREFETAKALVRFGDEAAQRAAAAGGADRGRRRRPQPPAGPGPGRSRAAGSQPDLGERLRQREALVGPVDPARAPHR